MTDQAAPAGLVRLLERVVELHKAKLIDEAAALSEEILQQWPQQPDALNLLAVARRAQGRLDEAEQCYRAALVQKPDSPELLSNLGNTLRALKRPAEAEAVYGVALGLRAGYRDAQFGLACALSEQGLYAAAVPEYRKVLTVAPRDIEGRNNLANALRELGQLPESIKLFEDVLRDAPNLAPAHYNLASSYFLSGDLVAGGPHYEWRWELESFQARRGVAPQIPRWEKGQSIAGKTVLLTHEQGLGDTLMFLRFAKLVQAQGARVVVEVQPLLRWLVDLVPGVEVYATGQRQPEADLKAPLMSLPYLLGLSYETLPAFSPYLRPPAHAEAWRAALGDRPGLKVGLFWQGNPNTTIDRGRSFPLAALMPLGAVRGVRLISLQNFAGCEQLDNLPPGFAVEQLGAEYSADDSLGLYDTAGVIANLDLLVTSDTGAAHLAGALGKPAWVMLRKVPEWRWLLDRPETPWYPQHRLFRQEKDGDWSFPVRAMVAALERELA